MEPNILFIIIGAVALIVGILLGKFIFAKNTKKQLENAAQQAQKIIAPAPIAQWLWTTVSVADLIGHQACSLWGHSTTRGFTTSSVH